MSLLDDLLGEWDVVASNDGVAMARGQTSIESLEDGKFLVLRAGGAATPEAPAVWHENAPFPTVSVIGLDDAKERFTMLYADARGVSRVYEVSIEGDTWKTWRDAPGFFQRNVSTIARDTITGAWERSEDGVDWQHDFDVTYTRRA